MLNLFNWKGENSFVIFSMKTIILLFVLVISASVFGIETHLTFQEDKKTPEEFKKQLRETFQGLHDLYYPELIVPTRLTIITKKQLDNAYFSASYKEEALTMPYIYKSDVGDLKSDMPTFAHEIGHYFHYMNMIKMSKEIRKFYMTYADQDRAAEETGDAIVKEKLEAKDNVLSYYSELVADFIGAVYFDDPRAMVDDCDLQEESCQARWFENLLDVETWTDDEVHGLLGPAHSQLWKLFKVSKLKKAEFTKRVIKASVVEIEKTWSAKSKRSVAQINADFISSVKQLLQ